MEADLISAEIDGLVNVAKWISGLLVSGVLLSLSIVVLRILQMRKFKIGEIELSIEMFPLLVVCYSFAHAFLTWIFWQRTEAILLHGSQNAKLAFTKLITSEAFVFFNMKPRFYDPNGGPFHIPVFVASRTDTAFWLTLSFSVAVVTAITASLMPERISTRSLTTVRKLIYSLGVGGGLASINWLIGSQWAIAASLLVK